MAKTAVIGTCVLPVEVSMHVSITAQRPSKNKTRGMTQLYGGWALIIWGAQSIGV